MKRLKKKTVNLGVGILFWFAIVWVLSACSDNTSKASISEADLFTFTKTQVNHSIGFDIIYHDQWKEVLLFRHYNDLVDTVRYALLPSGLDSPEGFDSNHSIQIPVSRIASMSTTHLGMFEFINAQENLKAIENSKYVSSQEIKERVNLNEIVELSPAGEMNLEVAIAADLDVLLGVGYPNSPNEAYQNLENLGVPVLLNADWQEKTLLGRAEWVKLLAALLNKEAEVNPTFEALEERYTEISEILESAKDSSPTVITGLAQGDVWYVAGGRSFAYYLLELAGVNYPWAQDESTGSVRLSFESVYEQGLKADYWLVPSVAKTLQEITDADPRYQDFKSFKKGKIFNIYGRFTPNGGNDFYESAVMNPDVVLKDIGKIFHPELFSKHELVYYNRLQ